MLNDAECDRTLMIPQRLFMLQHSPVSGQDMLSCGFSVLEFRRQHCEFFVERCAKWFKETGIQWEPSAPYTPEQNGVIEKAMYTIVAPIRAVHKTYQIPMGLWDHTIEAIAYTWNRITTTSSCKHDTTPFEMVNGVQPDVSNLRALGCRSYVHVPKATLRPGS